MVGERREEGGRETGREAREGRDRGFQVEGKRGNTGEGDDEGKTRGRKIIYQLRC